MSLIVVNLCKDSTKNSNIGKKVLLSRDIKPYKKLKKMNLYFEI